MSQFVTELRGELVRYHVAFHLPRATGEMVVAPDARLMIASAMEDLAECLLEEGKPLPTPDPKATSDADLIELVSLSVQ